MYGEKDIEQIKRQFEARGFSVEKYTSGIFPILSKIMTEDTYGPRRISAVVSFHVSEDRKTLAIALGLSSGRSTSYQTFHYGEIFPIDFPVSEICRICEQKARTIYGG